MRLLILNKYTCISAAKIILMQCVCHTKHFSFNKNVLQDDKTFSLFLFSFRGAMAQYDTLRSHTCNLQAYSPTFILN